MNNCWHCHKPIVRQCFDNGRLESLSALNKRQTCHDNEECRSALATHRKAQVRVKNAKWYYEFPDTAERFCLGLKLKDLPDYQPKEEQAA